MLPNEMDSELQQDISRIDEKRKVLEQIVEITQAIEQMQDSLNAVLILGEPSSDLPPEAAKLFQDLSGRMQNLPTNQIKDYLQKLERVINSQLEEVLRYSGFDFDSDEAIEILTLSGDSADSETSPIEMLRDFKRTSQTAVSLRVLLKKRGVSTAGAVISVPKQVIEKQFKALEEKEQQQRKKVKEKVVEMKEDINAMIENPDYPDAMKEVLNGVLDNLDSDIKLIESGGKMDKLSFMMDTEEITEAVQQEDEVEEIVLETPGEAKKRSMADKANEWLNSPWSTSWKDIKDEAE